MLRTLWRKKVLVVFLLALLILLPAASVRPAHASSKAIFLSVGIEKAADGYTVIGAMVDKKVVSADGATVLEAIEKITADQGRKVSLAHCTLIVLSANLADENVADTLRYFLEKFEVTNNALLVWTDADVAKLLETSAADIPAGGSLETIAAHNQEVLFKHPLTLDRFFKDYLRGRAAYMTSATLEGEDIKNTKLLAKFEAGFFTGISESV